VIQGEVVAPEFKPITHQERWHIIGHISQEVQKVVHKHPSFLERLEIASVRLHSGIALAVMVLAISFISIRVVGEGLITYVLDPFFNHIYGPAIRCLFKSLPFPFPSTSIARQNTCIYGIVWCSYHRHLYSPGDCSSLHSFFLFILGLWEDIGYLPRLAVLSDRIMHRLGLHGHAIIPLILSCGCKVPEYSPLGYLNRNGRSLRPGSALDGSTLYTTNRNDSISPLTIWCPLCRIGLHYFNGGCAYQ